MRLKEVRILSVSGSVGLGFPEASLREGLARNPDVIGCDGGSTDPGPYYLATGDSNKSRDATKRDLRLMILAGLERGIPVIVGSVGASGNDLALQWTRKIVEDIASESSKHFRCAFIHSEQDKGFIKQVLRSSRLEPLITGSPLATEAEIDGCEHIVGVMGVEPIQKALRAGAQVVLAGRSSDTSIFAALPLMRGLAEGPVWHASKLLESGAGCAEPQTPSDSLLATVRDDEFFVEPMNPSRVCTPLSTAAAYLYENGSLLLYEPTGVIDASQSSYVALNDRAVRVTGSQFTHSSRYTVKLEGAQKVGYRAISIGGIRDPILLPRISELVETVRNRTANRIADMYGSALSRDDYALQFRVYGLNAVMGSYEREDHVTGHEVAMIIDVVAPTQEYASTILKAARADFTHSDFPGRLTVNAGNLAFPYSPPDIDMGAVYRFALNSLVVSADPDEMFPIDLVEL